MSTLDRSVAPAPAPLREFRFPDIHRLALSNGMTVLHARHGDAPIVTIYFVADAGAVREGNNRAGLAQLTANLLETGTGDRDAQKIAVELETLGAQLQTSVGWDAATLALTVPAAHAAHALSILGDIVIRPAFVHPELERLRQEQLGQIVQRRQDPRLLAADVTGRFLYAPTSPYARPLAGSAETVAALGDADVQRFYDERFGPGASALLLVGAVDDALIEAARNTFEGWMASAVAGGDVPVDSASDHAEVHVIDRPGSVQSELRIGHVGLPRHHPDYFPVVVMNAILGGLFTSRLNLNLRERHGFTYGVRSGFAFRRFPGPFVVQAAVANDVTARAVEETLREIHALRDRGAATEEVAAARDFLSGILPLELQTTEQLAARLAELFVFDLPDDYFHHYRRGIAAVTPDDVLRVAREHIRPERLAVVVVGSAEHVEQPLRDLNIGPVLTHTIDE